ncbi:MAG TPA: hypothetical protein VGL27_04565 [Negativicutes bacterium]
MMNTISLVNNDLDRLAHYISRITALKNSKGRGLSKNEYYVN